MFSSIFNLEKRSSIEVLSLVYKVGMIPLLYKAYLFGRYLYLNNTYEKGFTFLQDGQTWFSSKPVNNAPLGIVGGIIFFIISIFIWKLGCELFLIMFRYFESNTK